MEVVDFLRPEQPPKPTATDLAKQLVSQVGQPADAVKFVSDAVISKAQTDAQAALDAAVESIEGEEQE